MFSDGVVLEESFELSVDDVNEMPSSVLASLSSFDEGVDAGSVVAQLSAIDPDADDAVEFLLPRSLAGSNDNSFFTIQGNELIVNSVPDFETKQEYSLLIRAIDRSGLSSDYPLTLSVNDVNESPSEVVVTSFQFEEGLPVGSTVAQLSSDDPDLSDSITFSLLRASDSDHSKFRIDGDRLNLLVVPDFEAQSSYQLLLRATDQNGLFADTQVQLDVSNINESPTSLNVSSNEIAFDAKADSIVAVISTVDPDVGDIFKYSFSSTAGSQISNNFRLLGDKLILLKDASSLAQSEFVIPIQVIDQHGLSYDQDLTFSVQPEPTQLLISDRSFSESTETETRIASLSLIGPESYRDLTFSLIATDDAPIPSAIALDGSELKLIEPLNFETQSKYTITIRAEDDDGYMLQSTFELDVLDANEPPQGLFVSSSNISEDLSPRSLIATFTASDPDVDDDFTYSLLYDDLDTDNGHFFVVGDQLRSRKSFDFETKSTYVIRAQVSDRSGQSFVDDLVLSVLDVNDAPYGILISPTEFSESAPAGSPIALIEALDQDHDDVFSFALVDGIGAWDNDYFSIDGNQLVINVDPDFEVKDTYRVRLQVTDSGGLTFEDSFLIPVTDSNEPPYSLHSSSSSIAREMTAGDPVAWLQASDPDTNDQLSFSLTTGDGDTDNDRFVVVGNQLVLDSPAADADQLQYSVRLRVTDRAGSFYEDNLVYSLPISILSSTTGFDESLSVGSTVSELSITGLDDSSVVKYSLLDQSHDLFSISGNQLILSRGADYEDHSFHQVTLQALLDSGEVVQRQIRFQVFDQNDAPHSLDVSTTLVEENAARGSSVARLTGFDQDAGDRFEFSLLSVVSNGDLIDDVFELKDNQLVLASDASSLDSNSYDVSLRVTDQSGTFYDRTFVFSLVPTITLSNDLLLEGLTPYTSVATIGATSDDFGFSRASLVPGLGSTDNHRFVIDNDQLRIQFYPDHETQSSYQIRLQANGSNGQILERAFDLLVPNVNESPFDLTLDADPLFENNSSVLPVGLINAKDPDVDDLLTYSLVAGDGDDDNALFTVEGDQLLMIGSPDYELQSSLSVRLQVSDRSGLSVSQSFAIDVLDANDAPSKIVPSTLFINSNAPPRSTIANLSTLDQDSNDRHSLSLVDSALDNHLFSLSGRKLKLMPNVQIAGGDVYSVQVQSTDRSGESIEQILEFSVNHAPTEISTSRLDLFENLLEGDQVLSFSTLDPDSGDQFVYSFAPGFGAADNDMFTLDGNKLLTRVPADFEDDSSLDIRIRSTDQNGLSTVEHFVLTVRDVDEVPVILNEPPSLIRSSSAVIPRSGAPGDFVGWLQVLDPDRDDVHTLELIKGASDSDNHLFSVVGTQLRLADSVSSLDRSSLSVSLRATDSHGESVDQVLTYGLPTTILSSSVQFPETLSVGDAVAELFLSGDEASDEVSFRIDSSSSRAFSVESNRLVLSEPLDFEAQSQHRLTLSATDSFGQSIVRELTFFVDDVNEAPSSVFISTNDIPQDAVRGDLIGTLSGYDQDLDDALSFELLSVTVDGESASNLFSLRGQSIFLKTDAANLSDSPHVLSVEVSDRDGATFVDDLLLSVTPAISLSSTKISEGLQPFTPFATLSTTNDDVGDISYSLVSSDTSDDNRMFSIVDDQLYVNFYPDHEQRSDYTVSVQSIDSTSSTMQRVFDLQVSDLNETPYDLSLSEDYFDENLPAGSLIALIAALDPDQGDSLAFSLVSGDGDDDNDLFRVVDNQLLVRAVPDFEAQSQYSIRLRATDRGLLSVENSFELSVLDQNDAPRLIIPSTNFINADADARSIVAEFSTLDDDPRDFHRYSLSGDVLDNDLFFLYGNKLKLQTGVDLSEQSSYSIRVESSDFDGATVQQDFEFSLNHPPESIELSTAALLEDLPIGSQVLQFSTSDPDVDDRFDYSFDPGFGSLDNDLFTIAGDRLLSKVPADYESDSSLNVRIRSTDQNGFSVVEKFLLDVIDIDEAPSLPVLSSGSVDENVAAGSVVATVASSDPDRRGPVSYQIRSLNSSSQDRDESFVDDATLFSFDGDQLVIDVSPDFESKSSYSFVIRAVDSTGLFTDSEVVVSVNDLTEPLVSSETVVLPDHLDTLYLSGDLPINGFGNDSDNTLFGTTADNILAGRGGADVLTGLSGSDTYLLERYSDSLLSAPDTITGFVMGVDRLDAPTAVDPDLIQDTGVAPGLNADSLAQHLSAARFPADSAALFTIIDPFSGLRSYLALNNRVAGYSPATDAVIDISGYIGEFSDLLVI